MSCKGKTGDALKKCKAYEVLKKRYENYTKKDTILSAKGASQEILDLKLSVKKARAAEKLALKKQKDNTTRVVTYNTKGSANEDKKVTQNKKTKVYTGTIKVNKEELKNTIVKKSIKVKDTKKKIKVATVKPPKPKGITKPKVVVKPKKETKTKPKVVANPTKPTKPKKDKKPGFFGRIKQNISRRKLRRKNRKNQRNSGSNAIGY